MAGIHVEVSSRIEARPQAIYAILSDYQIGHPAILPKPYFSEIKVEQGGSGAGTVILIRMNVMGREMVYHETVTEPEPGRVLVETDAQAGVTTTFTVDPLDGGSAAQVTIATDLPASPGIAGFFERLFTPPVIRRIYRQELQQLAAYVASQPAPG